MSSLTSGFLNSGCALSSRWKRKCELLSLVWLFSTPWTVAHQAPLSMEFSKQEYCSGLPFPSPGDLPDPGIKPRSPALQADFFFFFTVWATKEAPIITLETLKYWCPRFTLDELNQNHWKWFPALFYFKLLGYFSCTTGVENNWPVVMATQYKWGLWKQDSFLRCLSWLAIKFLLRKAWSKKG